MKQAILRRLNLNFWPFTRGRRGPAFSQEPRFFTASEKELIVQQLRAGNEIAREFARGRGYALHPLLAPEEKVKGAA